MSSLWRNYHLPRSFDEALELLRSYGGRARIVAGGTDLILELQQSRRPPVEALVDITRVEGLDEISLRDGWITIGAAVTHARIVESALLRERATALVEACGVIGGPQVRNVATLCGNVVHALPAADGTLALLALGAEGQVASKMGRQWLPLSDLFRGPGVSAIDPTSELLTAVRFRPTGDGEGSAFERVMRPQGVALPMFVVAVWVRLDPSRCRFEDVRIALGPVAPVPFRARAAEKVFRGSPVDDDVLERAVQAALGEVNPRTSRHRATREYRLEMVRLLLPRALRRAVQRANEVTSQRGDESIR